MSAFDPHAIFRSIPNSVRPADSNAELDWLSRSIRPPSKEEDGVRLSAIIPSGFPSYARVLHPAYRREDHSPVSWAEVANRMGKTAHPLMKFSRICGLDGPNQSLDWVREPPIGRPTEEVARELAGIWVVPPPPPQEQVYYPFGRAMAT